MTKQIEAVAFDFDGTLIDTFEHIVQAFEKVLPEHGAVADRAAITEVIGMTLHQCYEQLHPTGDHRQMAEHHHAVQQSPEMYELITVYDGVLRALTDIRRANIKTAITTNRSRRSVDLIMTHLGMADIFNTILTHEDVSAPKPDPEVLIVLSKRLGIPVHKIAIVGDTRIDIETGSNAGAALAIGVTHGFGSRESLARAGADFVVDSFNEIPKKVGVK